MSIRAGAAGLLLLVGVSSRIQTEWFCGVDEKKKSCLLVGILDEDSLEGAMGSSRVALAAAAACFQRTEVSRLLSVFSIFSLRSDS